MAKSKTRKTAALRGNSGATFSDSAVQVDAEAGVIRNVALITVGPAKGHGFELDQQSVDAIQKLAAAQPDGVKCRFRHPPITEKTDAQGNIRQSVGDDTGSMVGRIKNVRIEGNQARGDVFIGDYAENVPGQGNLRKYLLDFASSDPAGIGMSAFFNYEPEVTTDQQGNPIKIIARPSELYAIDFVGEPAANPNGLLSAKSEEMAAKPLPRGSAYLKVLIQEGPLNLGGLANRSRFSGRYEALRADIVWLVGQGYVLLDAKGICTATPKAITAMAAIGVWKQK
jgi:hypothetical protein